MNVPLESQLIGDSRQIKLSGRAHRAPLLKTFAAVDGPALSRLEGNRSFLPALRAGGFRFGALKPAGTGAFCSSRLAGLTTLGLVLEALIGEEHLLAGGENKVRTAFRALQDPIVIFHGGSEPRELCGVAA
jgi:hypothetical protein